MDKKILIYVGIAGLAYYLYTKSQDFKFTEAEKTLIFNIAKGNPLRTIFAARTILTKERAVELEKWLLKNPNQIPN